MFSFTVTRRDGQRVVTFDADVDTREAYDMTQTSDDIQDGDVLVVPGEGVVGIMASAWPCAVVGQPGEFHIGNIGVEYQDAYRVALKIGKEV